MGLSQYCVALLSCRKTCENTGVMADFKSTITPGCYVSSLLL